MCLGSIESADAFSAEADAAIAVRSVVAAAEVAPNNEEEIKY